jgi:hypothetical protein
VSIQHRDDAAEATVPPAAFVDGTGPTGAAGEEPAAPVRRAWLEPAIDSGLVLILVLATLAAAWSGYQSARWSGVQSTRYSQASARRIESTRTSTYANQLTIVDIMTFTNFVNAWTSGDTELADFYEQRFRPDFRPAFDAWMATDPLANPDAPPSPFAMPEYALPQTALAQQLDAEANVLFREGQDANQDADNYVLNTVFLAGALVLVGLAPRIGWVPARIALACAALLIFALGLYNIATYPIE